jgi:hypothetical protein
VAVAVAVGVAVVLALEPAVVAGSATPVARKTRRRARETRPAC